jgi:hypothetical protein
MGISLALPGGDFVDEGLLVGNAAVEALSGENAEFGFGQIKPPCLGMKRITKSFQIG